MADDIQKLDLGDAAKQLKTKIQSAFIDMIPAEQWQAMIEGELKKFTTETRTPSEYSNNRDTVTPPAFQTMAQGILLEVAREVRLILADRMIVAHVAVSAQHRLQHRLAIYRVLEREAHVGVVVRRPIGTHRVGEVLEAADFDVADPRSFIE